MKILKIILFIIFALVVLAAAGVYIFLQTFKVERYKPQIIAAAEKALGRDCDFREIELHFSWQKGVGVKVSDLTIRDDPYFQDGNLLKVAQLDAGIDVFSFIMTRQVAVSSIRVVSPELHLFRSADGQFNLLALGKPPVVAPAPPPAGASNAPLPIEPKSPSAAATSLADVPPIYIDHIGLEQGLITFVDRMRPTELGFQISDVSANVQRFSLQAPFTVQLEAALLAPQKNVSAQATVQLNLKTPEASIREAKAGLDLAPDTWEKLRFALSGFTTATLPSTLNGHLTAEIKELSLGPQGIKKSSLDARLDNGRLLYRDDKLGVSLDAPALSAGVKNFSLDAPFSFDVNAAVFTSQNNLTAAGTAQLDLARQGLRLSQTTVSTDLGTWPLEKLKSSFAALTEVPFPEVLKGTLRVTLKDLALDAKGLVALLADADWANGAITAADLAPGVSLQAAQVNLKAQNFNLAAQPFQFTVNGAFYSTQPNLSAQGTASLDLNHKKAALTATQVSADLSLWPLEKIKEQLAFLQPVPLPQELKGQLQLDLKELSADPQGLKSFLVNAKLANGTVRMREALPGISLDLSKVNLEMLGFSLAPNPIGFVFEGGLFAPEPNVYLDGELTFDAAKRTVRLADAHVSSDLAKLPLDRIRESMKFLSQLPFPEKLGGKFSAEVHEFVADPTGLQTFTGDVQWQGGVLRILNVTPGVSLDASNVMLDAKSFNIAGEPFKLILEGALFGDKTNFYSEGLADLNLKEQTLQLKNTDVSSDLALLPLARIKESVQPLASLPIPDAMQGKLQLAIKELSAGANGLTALHLNADLAGGALTIEQLAPGIALAAKNVDLKLNDLDLSGAPFNFSLKGAFYGSEPNVALDGTATVDLAGQALTLAKTQLTSDLSRVSLSQLKSSLAALKDVPFPEELAGQLNVQIDDLRAGAKGLASLTMQADLTKGRIKHPLLNVPIAPIAMNFNATPTLLTLNQLSFPFGDGLVEAKGTVDDYVGKQSFAGTVNVKGLDLAKILDQSKQPVKIEGIIDGEYELAGEGFTEAKLKSALSGKGLLQVKNGLLKNINLLQEILDKLSMFPGLRDKIQATIPERYKETLAQQDTLLKKVQFDSVLEGGAFVVNPIDVEADGFSLAGQGRIGLDSQVNIATSFLIAPDLTAGMVQAVPNLEYLLNSEQQIQFPVKIAGKLPNVTPAVDVEYILRTALQNKGKEELKKVIQKAIGIEDKTSETPSGQPVPPPSGGAPPPDEEPSPEKIIGTILDSIFKK